MKVWTESIHGVRVFELRQGRKILLTIGYYASECVGRHA